MPIVQEFDNLYAGKLFIVKYEDIENTSYIGKKFRLFDGKKTIDGIEFDDCIITDSSIAHAGAYSVQRKSDNMNGVLLVIYEDLATDIIAHEAVHIADYFCEFCNITTQDFSDGNEHYAYLVGWAAGCIAKVLTNKKIRNNG